MSDEVILIVKQDCSFVFFGPCLYGTTCPANIRFLAVFSTVAVVDSFRFLKIEPIVPTGLCTATLNLCLFGVLVIYSDTPWI